MRGLKGFREGELVLLVSIFGWDLKYGSDNEMIVFMPIKNAHVVCGKRKEYF
jgi:hypothetical protein